VLFAFTGVAGALFEAVVEAGALFAAAGASIAGLLGAEIVLASAGFTGGFGGTNVDPKYPATISKMMPSKPAPITIPFPDVSGTDGVYETEETDFETTVSA
jgi:hypothetical protein